MKVWVNTNPWGMVHTKACTYLLGRDLRRVPYTPTYQLMDAKKAAALDKRPCSLCQP